ncbi:hypothetical protein [Glaciibacter superstes]|uniref:hypothetical protein n=1 Tax=Glaciibacter superstes TaxID=501023 RepID=UPI0003B39273|nr:hypothetical protein [Glaciibacter superstes]
MSFRIAAATALALSVSVIVAGCTAAPLTDGTPTPTRTAEATPRPTPTATPQPTTTELAPGPALLLDCAGLLNAESLAEFDAGSFGLPDQAGIDGYVDKTRGEGDSLALFADYGGVLCPVTNGTRVSELFGYSPITAEQSAEQQARLALEGYTISDHNGGVLLSDTSGQESAAREYLFLDGYWATAFDVIRVDEVVANAPVA